MRLTRNFISVFILLTTVGCGPSRHRDLEVPLAPHDIADCALDREYFPDAHSILNGDVSPVVQGMQTFYELEFRAMHEPSLYVCTRRPQQHVYRLLWERALMSQPMARLTIAAGGTGELELKLLDRECMPPPPGAKIGPCSISLQRHAMKLDQQKTAHALRLLQTMPWHKTPAQLAENSGTDGADWVFEERNGDRYRFADFREPSPEAAELTQLLFWDWTSFLPASERRTTERGFYY